MILGILVASFTEYNGLTGELIMFLDVSIQKHLVQCTLIFCIVDIESRQIDSGCQVNSSEQSIQLPRTKRAHGLTQWAQILKDFPLESFYTEWKTFPAHRRWETGRCNCTDDDGCPHKVSAPPPGWCLQSSDFSAEKEKTVVITGGDLILCQQPIVRRYESMWWCRSGLSYCMFAQGVVQ